MFREEYGINLLAKLKFYNLYLYKKEKNSDLPASLTAVLGIR